MSDLKRYQTRDELMSGLASQIATELAETLKAKGHASLAIPGGSTPGLMFDKLSQAELDWAKVAVLLTDERRVPSTHERSNERLVRARLIRNAASNAEFISVVDAIETGFSDGVLPIDELVLGMGADMHTASIFPGSPDVELALAPDADPLLYVEASDGLEPRITLSGMVLQEAKHAHVLITGSEKMRAYEVAKTMTPREAPINLVLANATVHWAE